MNERILEIAEQAYEYTQAVGEATRPSPTSPQQITSAELSGIYNQKFAELIVREMCGLMEQAEDDVYHCFEPSERPTECIEWLRDWQERFTKHFGVES